MQNQFFDLYRNGITTATQVATMSLQNAARLQQTQLAGAQLGRIAEFWSSVWQAAAENQRSLFQQVRSQSRSSEDVARAAANQASRAAGSVREASAPQQRKSA